MTDADIAIEAAIESAAIAAARAQYDDEDYTYPALQIAAVPAHELSQLRADNAQLRDRVAQLEEELAAVTRAVPRYADYYAQSLARGVQPASLTEWGARMLQVIAAAESTPFD
jgi:hypothetical protein